MVGMIMARGIRNRAGWFGQWMCVVIVAVMASGCASFNDVVVVSLKDGRVA